MLILHGMHSVSEREVTERVWYFRERFSSMRIDLEVLNSVDHIITTSIRDSECVSV